MKKIIAICALLAMGHYAAQAQGDWYLKNIMTLNWQFATPLNSDYLSNTSWVGGNFEFRHFVNKNVSIGAGISWNSFEQYVEPRVYEKPDGSRAIYTDMVKQLYTLPLVANAHYYFDAGNKVKPYLGVGLGGQYAEQSIYYNIFVSETDNWGFVARPEAGLLMKLGNYAGLHANIGYNFATNQNEDFRINNLQHLAFSIGGWWNVF